MGVGSGEQGGRAPTRFSYMVQRGLIVLFSIFFPLPHPHPLEEA